MLLDKLTKQEKANYVRLSQMELSWDMVCVGHHWTCLAGKTPPTVLVFSYFEQNFHSFLLRMWPIQ